jgi:hypothetical protein
MVEEKSLNELRKERRKLANERNTQNSKNKSSFNPSKRNKDKDKIVDLSSKDSISPKGLYV